jgi:hypothetical protein
MTEPNKGQQPSGNPGEPATPPPSEETIKAVIDGEMREIPMSKVVDLVSKSAKAEEQFRDAKLTREEVATLGGMERVRELAELGTLLDENPDLAENLAAAIQEKFKTPGGRREGEFDPAAMEETVVKTVRQEMEARRGEEEMERTLEELHKEHGDFDDQAVIAHGAERGIWNVKAAFEDLNKTKLLEARDKRVREETVKAIKEGRDLGEPGASPPQPPGPVSTEGMSVDQLADAILQDAKRGTLVPKK